MQGIPEELLKEFNGMKKQYDEVSSHAQDMRRLLDLAQKSPFAGANDDFLRRMWAELQHEERQLELMKMVLNVMEKKRG